MPVHLTRAFEHKFPVVARLWLLLELDRSLDWRLGSVTVESVTVEGVFPTAGSIGDSLLANLLSALGWRETTTLEPQLDGSVE